MPRQSQLRGKAIMKPDYKLVSQISLATGLAVLGSTGVARADELATLRANQAALSAQQIALDREQELLKARIEQLAQGPNPGSNPGAPGAPTPAAPTGRRQLCTLIANPRNQHIDPGRRLYR